MTGAARERAVPPSARVGQPADIPVVLRTLGVAVRRPVLVSVGGAGGMTRDQLAVMAKALERIVPALDGWGAAIVDGGTDSGVMQVMGQLRAAAGARFPLVGVAAEGTIILPGTPLPGTPLPGTPLPGTPLPGTSGRPDAAVLEPHHTQVILVPGQTWGDESPWLAEVATAIADGQPSLTLVVNGGQITFDDIDHSLQAGRPVIILAGTGRTADAIAAAARGDTGDPKAARAAASPGTRIVSLDDPQALYAAIESILAPPG